MAEAKEAAKPTLTPAQQDALEALAAKLQHAHFPPSHALWLEICALAKKAHPAR